MHTTTLCGIPYYWELNSAHFGASFMQIGYKLAEISQKFVFDLLVIWTLTFDPITPKTLFCNLGVTRHIM